MNLIFEILLTIISMYVVVSLCLIFIICHINNAKGARMFDLELPKEDELEASRSYSLEETKEEKTDFIF